MFDYIVERKRMDDLAGSIVDGRFKEQKVTSNKQSVWFGVCCCNKGIKSLAHGWFQWTFELMIFKLILCLMAKWSLVSCNMSIRWMSLYLPDDKSILAQVMAWCRQATSHYLSQCWPRYLSPYGITRPQWVNHSNILAFNQYTRSHR